MEHKYLRAFFLVAANSSFTAAAKQMGIAQSAVSRQVQLLEESVKTQLVVRSPQKVILTPAGQALFNEAKKFEQWSENYFFNVSFPIRIAIQPGILESWLVVKLAKMVDADIPNLHIRIGSVDSIQADLENGDVDLGFLTKKIENDAITSVKLFHEDFCLVSRDPVDLKKLQNYRWIYGERGHNLRRISHKVSSQFIQVNSLSAILRLVERGVGVAIVPSHRVEKRYKVKQIPLNKIQGTVYLAQPNYQIVPKYLKSFVEQLVE